MDNQEINTEPIYYVYDWDDNILFMPTKIFLDKMVNGVWVHKKVSTSKFRDVRHHIDNWNKKKCGKDVNNYKWRFRDDDIKKSVSEFRDWGKRGDVAFYLDVKKSVELKNFGPSFNSFINTLISGRIFLICTARGHEPDAIRSGVEYIITNYLTIDQKIEMTKNLSELFNAKDTIFYNLVERYLDICEYIGTDSTYFKNKVLVKNTLVNPEDSKKLAIKYFIDMISTKYAHLFANMKIKIGFSDDTVKTLCHVEKYMRDELSLLYPMEFYIIDTSNPKIEGGVKRKVD